MIKTKEKFDIKGFLSNETEIVKVGFSDIRLEDMPNGNKKVFFTVKKIIAENVPHEEPIIDAQGNYTYDIDGNILNKTVIGDITKFLYNDDKVITAEQYNQMADLVLQQMPSGLTRLEEDDYIKQLGFKLFLIQGGYGKGKFTSLNDFE